MISTWIPWGLEFQPYRTHTQKEEFTEGNLSHFWQIWALNGHSTWGFCFSMTSPTFLVEAKEESTQLFPWIIRCSTKQLDRSRARFIFSVANVVFLNFPVALRSFRSSTFHEFSPPHLPGLISSTSPSSLLPRHVQHILQRPVAMLLSALGNYSRLTSPFSPSSRFLC